jgi:hypothetical protein
LAPPHLLRRGILFAAKQRPKVRRIDSAIPGDEQLQEGLYKLEFHSAHGTGSGVIYATCLRDRGKLRGGNSGFAFIGHYNDEGSSIQVKVSTERHNEDPAFKPLFATDRITLTLKGRDEGKR